MTWQVVHSVTGMWKISGVTMPWQVYQWRYDDMQVAHSVTRMWKIISGVTLPWQVYQCRYNGVARSVALQ